MQRISQSFRRAGWPALLACCLLVLLHNSLAKAAGTVAQPRRSVTKPDSSLCTALSRRYSEPLPVDGVSDQWTGVRTMTARLVDAHTCQWECVSDDMVIGPCQPTAGSASSSQSIATFAVQPQGRFRSLASRHRIREQSVHNTLSNFRWPRGIIPYVLDDGSSTSSYLFPNNTDGYKHLVQALRMLNAETALTLQPRQNESDYIKIRNMGLCQSLVGKNGGMQYVSLEKFGTCSVGSTVHELLHAAGLFHEHQRLDRDQYINLDLNKVNSAYRSNFNLCVGCTDGGQYDYDSIMHYSPHTFAAGSDATFTTSATALSAFTAVYGTPNIGQRRYLSELDVAGVNALYDVCYPDATPECGGTAVYWKTNKWSTGCRTSCSSPGRTRKAFCHYANGSCAADSVCTSAGASKPTLSDDCRALLNCTFETGRGAWNYNVRGDVTDLTLYSGSTPTSLTGPSSDHTGGYPGNYVYLEASEGIPTGATAIMESIPMAVPGGTNLSFWFHFWGVTLGSLDVQVVSCDGATVHEQLAHFNSTFRANNWQFHSVVTNSTYTNSKFRFIVARGNMFSSDIALDDITVKLPSAVPAVGADVAVTCAPPPTPSPTPATTPATTPSPTPSQGTDSPTPMPTTQPTAAPTPAPTPAPLVVTLNTTVRNVVNFSPSASSTTTSQAPTSIEIPPNAFGSNVTNTSLTVQVVTPAVLAADTALANPSATAPAGTQATPVSFVLEASVGASVTFAQPLVVTLSLAAVSLSGVPELYLYNSSQLSWVPAKATCPTPYSEYISANSSLVTHVCHFTQFTVLQPAPEGESGSGINLNVVVPVVVLGVLAAIVGGLLFLRQHRARKARVLAYAAHRSQRAGSKQAYSQDSPSTATGPRPTSGAPTTGGQTQTQTQTQPQPVHGPPVALRPPYPHPQQQQRQQQTQQQQQRVQPAHPHAVARQPVVDAPSL